MQRSIVMRIGVLAGVWAWSQVASAQPAPAPAIELHSVAWSPDGKTVAVGAFRQTILIDVATRRELARVGESTDWHEVSFAPDGRLITQGGGPDSAPIHWRSIAWDARSGKRLAIEAAPSACATDTEVFWGCRADGTGWRGRYQSWKQEVVVERWDNATLGKGWTGSIGRSLYRPLIAVSPSGVIASAGKEAYSLVETEKMLVHKDQQTSGGVARGYFYQDSAKLVSGGYVRIHSRGGAFRCELLRLGKAITAFRFADDGASLVAGDSSGTVFLVSSDCKLTNTLAGLGGEAVGVASHGDLVVAVSRTGEVRWWDARKGTAVTDTIH